MYRQNGLLIGLCSVTGFIVAANSLFMDVFSTAQNLAWLMNWFENSNISTQINQLLMRIETIFQVLGFWFVFLPIAFFVWRNHARY